MLYRIIMTRPSDDGFTSYSLFFHEVEEDGLRAETYGVIAADYDCSLTIDDIETEAAAAKALFNKLAENSVRVNALHEYIIDYLSAL